MGALGSMKDMENDAFTVESSIGSIEIYVDEDGSAQAFLLNEEGRGTQKRKPC